MLRWVLISLIMLATPAAARDSLGVYGRWGAFRDDEGPRCYALAMPTRASGTSDHAAYASVSHWPAQRVRSQVYFRTSRTLAEGARITLRIGGAQFSLTGSANNAWAEDVRGDAAILAAMRGATSMMLSSRDARGRSFSNTYSLDGLASAVDAASIGCNRSR